MPEENSSKRVAILAIVAILFLLVGFLGGTALVWVFYKDKVAGTEKSGQVLSKKLDSCLADAKRLSLMTKTLSIAYPQISRFEAKYLAYIFKGFADSFKIDWCIYPAKIAQESNFNPTLVSKKDARGLCQLLSGTAEIQAKKLGIKYVKGVTEWNEFNNVAMGLNYLSEGVKDSGIEFGLRRYYSGGGRNKNEDIDAYYNNVYTRYRVVFYIYKGVLSEN